MRIITDTHLIEQRKNTQKKEEEEKETDSWRVDVGVTPNEIILCMTRPMTIVCLIDF